MGKSRPTKVLDLPFYLQRDSKRRKPWLIPCRHTRRGTSKSVEDEGYGAQWRQPHRGKEKNSSRVSRKCGAQGDVQKLRHRLHQNVFASVEQPKTRIPMVEHTDNLRIPSNWVTRNGGSYYQSHAADTLPYLDFKT